MLQAIILIGIPGSGKTTYALEFQLLNPSFDIIERDELRLQWMKEHHIQSTDDIRVDFTLWDWSNEPEITELEYALMSNSFNNGRDIIVSDTNLDTDHRSNMITFLRNLGFDTSIEFIEVSLDVAIQRDTTRQYPVGEVIITKLYNRWLQQFHTTRILR